MRSPEMLVAPVHTAVAVEVAERPLENGKLLLENQVEIKGMERMRRGGNLLLVADRYYEGNLGIGQVLDMGEMQVTKVRVIKMVPEKVLDENGNVKLDEEGNAILTDAPANTLITLPENGTGTFTLMHSDHNEISHAPVIGVNFIYLPDGYEGYGEINGLEFRVREGIGQVGIEYGGHVSNYSPRTGLTITRMLHHVETDKYGWKRIIESKRATLRRGSQSHQLGTSGIAVDYFAEPVPAFSPPPAIKSETAG